MNCNVIKDLIPLYIDECCSEETARLVDEHLKECESCLRVYNDMRCDAAARQAPSPAVKTMTRVAEWRASLMQSLALFISFALITFGVTMEAGTPAGEVNGAWLFGLIIPATAFMLGLANLYFIRLYRSRRSFALASCGITLGIALIAFIWGVVHYGVLPLIRAGAISSSLVLGLAIGAVLAVVFCIAAYLLAGAYAKALGKE